jgi:hypothetical protein
MAVGLSGKEIGQMKVRLLNWLDEHPDKNTKKDLMEQVLKFTN